MYKIFIFGLVIVAIVHAVPMPKPTYTTKYDDIDLDEILTNDRLFGNYYKCLMDEGTCSPDGAELKDVLPDALKTECSKCSEKQKEGSKKIFKYMSEHKKDEWAALEKKYDPNGEFKDKIAKLVA